MNVAQLRLLIGCAAGGNTMPRMACGWLLLVLLVGGCGDDSGSPAVDASSVDHPAVDASADAHPDAHVDAAADGGSFADAMPGGCGMSDGGTPTGAHRV